MRKALYFPLLTSLALSVGCVRGGGDSGKSVEPQTDDQKALYALGLDIARSLEVFNLKPNEVEIVKSGIGDSLSGKKSKSELEAYLRTWKPKVYELARARSSSRADAEKERGKTFADNAAKESGAVRTPSGLVWKTLKPGNGPSPVASDRVKVHYHGTLIDGTVFDSSVQRGQPAEFPLSGVIPCWTEGVQKMKVGEKARLVCPSTIAYGDRGQPPHIPGGSTLVFEVELLEILKPGATPTPPQMGMNPTGLPRNLPMLGAKPGMPMPPGHPVGMPMGAAKAPPPPPSSK